MINRNVKKKMVSFALVLTLTSSLISGCSKTKRNSDTDYSKVDTDKIKKTYNITFINSESDEIKKKILLGYKDSLNALLGKNHYTITEANVDSESSASMAALNSIGKGSDLILANGKDALSGTHDASTDIPVIGTGVLNFQTLLNTGNSGLLNATDSNTTGTSIISPMDDVMSLIIESAKENPVVGLFYSPEDDDAIYQNEALEAFMDSAGIPWKEYELTSSKTAAHSDENTSIDKDAVQHGATNKSSDSSQSAIEPKTPNTYGSIFGYDSFFDGIGENKTIESPSAPASARASKVSNDWAKAIAEDAPDFLKGSSNEDIIKYASSECNVIYIPGHSNISSEIDTISKLTTEAKVPTVTNDPETGKKTMTSLYTDPYAFGYSAGKQTYRILIKNEKTAEMAIESVPSSVSVKLYNKDIAEALTRSFPKSFHEYEDYLKNTKPGETTKKIEQ